MTRSKRQRRCRPAMTMVLAAVVFAGCGGGTPGPGAGGSNAPSQAAPTTVARACELLTDADIQEITGMSVVSKDDNVADTVYVNHCRWTIERSNGGTGELDLGILSPGGRDRYDHTGGSSGLEPIEGLPADAAGVESLTGSIFAVRDDTLVDVFALGLALNRDGRIAIVRRVLDNLFGFGGPPATATTGGQATQPAGGAASDPCTLLTDEDILAVTGYAALGHEGFPILNALSDAACIWEVQGASAVPATIRVDIKSPGGRASWDQYVVPIQGEFTAIDDLGDAAFGKVHWPTHVLVGDTYIIVLYSDWLHPPEEPISTELARRVVENLGG